ALTLGVRGQFDQTNSSDRLGGRNAARTGVESTSNYRQLTVDMWSLDADETPWPLDITLSASDHTIETSARTTSLHQALNLESGLFRHGAFASWGSLESVEFTTAAEYVISLPIPPRRENDSVDRTTSQSLAVWLSRQTPEARNRIRGLLYFWGEGYAKNVSDQLQAPTTTDVMKAMKSLVILRVKWNFDGDRQTRYLLCERSSIATKKLVTLKFDQSRGGFQLNE
ncbi:MAG: hypothetical protein KDA96_00705, partial [Planctomycetaceae bacterium]|nr:hypothetical protein [Planctomycetaceae bacterium]